MKKSILFLFLFLLPSPVFAETQFFLSNFTNGSFITNDAGNWVHSYTYNNGVLSDNLSPSTASTVFANTSGLLLQKYDSVSHEWQNVINYSGNQNFVTQQSINLLRDSSFHPFDLSLGFASVQFPNGFSPPPPPPPPPPPVSDPPAVTGLDYSALASGVVTTSRSSVGSAALVAILIFVLFLTWGFFRRIIFSKK